MSELIHHWALGPFRYNDITSAGEVYLRRYEFRTRLLSVKLHRFFKGDDDRALHDHPWRWWFTIPLTTGYFEETDRGVEFVRRWRIHKRGAHKHRVVEPDNSRPCWTLIVCGPICRKWGFYPVDGGDKTFIPFDEWPEQPQ